MPLSKFQPEDYESLLQAKVDSIKPGFSPYFAGEADIFTSPPTHYRMRAEFRMWHDEDGIHYVMFRPEDPKTPHKISDFPVACRAISDRMAPLQAALNTSETLKRRLFQLEFLATTTGDTLLVLVYHRKLDETWQQAARELAEHLDVQIIGRSRKQKVVLERDYVTEELQIGQNSYSYRQAEGVFTQPNALANQHMINWVMEQVGQNDDDLLELYCGIGNFTLPLASRFGKVLATEISKQAVRCALHNAEVNQVDNLALLRMSSEEFTQAWDKVRPFRRLKDTDLDSYQLNTLLVDPPRAGLDEGTVRLASRFKRIVYISCNPATLLANLVELDATHRVSRLAFFDQFPYTDHLECGVILERRAD